MTNWRGGSKNSTAQREIHDFEKEQKGWMEVEQAIPRAVEVRRKLAR